VLKKKGLSVEFDFGLDEEILIQNVELYRNWPFGWQAPD
jgi:hypothetical protein